MMRRRGYEKAAGRILILPAAGWILVGQLTTSAKIRENITVCILDSGCCQEDISGWNFLSGSENIGDEQGHGTDIVTLLQEEAPEAELIMLKCFDSEVNPDSGAVRKALRVAVDQYHADLIHMSWTLNEEDESLHQEIRHAAEQGVILVAATGNLSFETGLGDKVYPAAWEEVIGVGGVRMTEEGPKSSLWYLTGEEVYVCGRADYGEKNGTSYAAARVSGKIAAFLEEERIEKEERLECVLTMLKERATDLGENGYDTIYGWGYIGDDGTTTP